MAIEQKIAFVTGGTGKIGQFLVRRLTSLGFFVKVLTRKETNPWLRNDKVQIIKGDISDEAILRKEIPKCGYVFHLAVYQNINDRKKDLFLKVNIEGVKNILNSALNSGIKKILYVSTINVFKPTGKAEADESWPLKVSSEGDYYAQTKLEALAFVHKMKEKLPIVIAYPTAVIDLNDFSSAAPEQLGRFQKFLWEKIGGGVPGGLVSRVGPGDRIFNYVVVEDLVEGLVLAALNGKPGEGYILGGENIAVKDYLKAASKRAGKSAPDFRIPFWILKLVSFFGWVLPLPRLVKMISKNRPVDLCFSSKKAGKDLGYGPKLKV